MRPELRPFPELSFVQRGLLEEMYESPERFDEGLLSFTYPLLTASDDELDHFLGGLVRRVGRAVRGAVATVGRAAKTVGKAVSKVDKIVPMSALTSTLR